MVAIKIMDVSQIKEEYVVKNLYREARIMSQLQHPCITALFQTMQNGNVYYIVSELAGGGDLCTYIKNQKNGKLEEKQTKIFARQLMSALAHMHNVGIVHRDLKMENVMLNSVQTQIKIVDFGLSNVFSPDNPLRTHCGSPEYAAPELFIAGKSYGPEVDLWSLGVILYGMVVGQLPFLSNREEQKSAQDRRKKLLEQINKGLSAPQKRALVSFSSEFKGMMSKLLIADSTKRLTILELTNHPWVTDKGQKSIKLISGKRTDDKIRSSIVKQLSVLLKADMMKIKYSLSTEPLGDIAGMYNILLTKYKQIQITTDGIMQTIPNHISCYITPRFGAGDSSRNPSPHKSSNYAAMLSKRHTVQSAQTPKNSNTSSPTAKRPASTNSPGKKSYVNAKKVIVKKSLLTDPKHLALVTTQKSNTSQQSKNNTTVTINKKMSTTHSSLVKERPFKTSSSNSSTPCSANSNASKVAFIETEQHKHNALRIKKSMAGGIMHNNASFPRQNELSNNENVIKISTMYCNDVQASHNCQKDVKSNLLHGGRNEVHVRIHSANISKDKTYSLDKTTSESTSNQFRPQTGPSHKIPYSTDRTLKRRSLLPVMKTQSTSAKGVTTITPALADQRNPGQTISKASTASIRRTNLARGDSTCATINSTNNKSPIILRNFMNEPIARSIAGYVVNNIPEKLQYLKLIQEQPSENAIRK